MAWGPTMNRPLEGETPSSGIRHRMPTAPVAPESPANPSQADIDALWAAEAERRVSEIDSGKVKPIPGEQVFKELRKRLGR